MTNSTNGKGSEEESREALLKRLIKILGMTTSDNDNMALVAIRRANDCIEKLETDWESLLKGKVTIIADPFSVAPPPPMPSAPPPSGGTPRRHTQPPRPQPAPPPPKPQPAAQSKPQWKPAAPPRFSDSVQIKAALDKCTSNPIKHQGTAWRIKQIEAEFQARGSLEQQDWSFLCGTAAALRGGKVTADML